MKPSNRIMCPDCMRQKMLFETERKANNFIKWNADKIKHGEHLRAYYCPACCGWHISHQQHRDEYDNKTENLIDAYNKSVKGGNRKKIDRLIHYVDYEKQAQMIFDKLPDKIKHIPYKTTIKKYLSAYFQENNIVDNGGDLRGAIYMIWQKNNNNKTIK